jgi:stage IV sporulation protein B
MIKTTDRRKIPGLFFFTIIVVTFYIFLVQLTAVVPAEMRVSVGERVDLNNLFPSCISTRLTALVFEEEGVLKWQDGCKEKFSLQQGQNPLAVIPGDVKLDLRLFGLIPFKKVTLQVVPPISVMAGGHSIGVLMNSEGVLAVGCSDIILENGKKSCPARDVGISPGTAILNVEGRKVHSDTHLSFLIDHFAREKDTIHLDVIYKGKKRKIKIKPQFCSETGRYRIGLLVQDGASGVGTLTFYDPQTKKYGALGHLITNSEGNKSREFKDGRIVPASVQRIHKGEEGKIGEKVGYFAGKGATGKINKNTQVYISTIPGEFNCMPNCPLYSTGSCIVPLCYSRVKFFGNSSQQTHFIDYHENGIPNILISSHMGRNPHLMHQIGDIYIQITCFGKGFLHLPPLVMSQLSNTICQYLQIKRFENVVIGT